MIGQELDIKRQPVQRCQERGRSFYIPVIGVDPVYKGNPHQIVSGSFGSNHPDIFQNDFIGHTAEFPVLFRIHNLDVHQKELAPVCHLPDKFRLCKEGRIDSPMQPVPVLFRRTADIIIAAMGSPNFVTADMVKEGAVVIDVGTTRLPSTATKSGWKLTGDVKFDEVSPLCSYITPVPGGVGPMTIVSLMRNTLLAGKKEIYK